MAPATAPPPLLTNALEQAYFTSLADAANVLLVRTSVAGDFSPYELRLVNSATQAQLDPFEVTEVLTGFDPQLAAVQFSFKVECGPDFDCAPQSPACAPTLPAPPPINYLAKDYGSFRTLILDRFSQLLPAWAGTSEADLGVALAELIAYVGDHFSYQQDAVSTEAYLETARSRISLRRHALLVDYHVHDGANARAWIQLQAAGNPGDQIFLDRSRTRFYTFAPGMPSDLAFDSGNEEAALRAGVEVFEPMWDAALYPEHNQMSFYTWGDTSCCLPQGATEATLAGSLPNLHAGDVLIFQEVLGPQTGDPADADIRHRHAVRLTGATTHDGSGNSLVDPLFLDAGGQPLRVTEINWSEEDALPFPICISSTWLDASGNEQTVSDVSVAFGNVVLADHGLSMPGKDLGIVPEPRIFFPAGTDRDHCDVSPRKAVPPRFRPRVPDSPLTQAVPFEAVSLPRGRQSRDVRARPAGSFGLCRPEGFGRRRVSPVAGHQCIRLAGIVRRRSNGEHRQPGQLGSGGGLQPAGRRRRDPEASRRGTVYRSLPEHCRPELRGNRHQLRFPTDPRPGELPSSGHAAGRLSGDPHDAL